MPEDIKAQIEAELTARAASLPDAQFLTVDYYRIRRRVAHRLPIREAPAAFMRIADIPNYPWHTWLLWSLEERIMALGWAAEWQSDDRCRAAASRDIEALAQWPVYHTRASRDLPPAHAIRILGRALQSWPWIDSALRTAIHGALRRAVDEAVPLLDAHYESCPTRDTLLALPDPHNRLQNISLIETAMTACAALMCDHDHAERLTDLAVDAVEVMLELRKRGFSEGVTYDGYVLDFVADWLPLLPDDQRQRILTHDRIEDALDQSLYLAAPGSMVDVVELGDVEPVEMPFHLSAQAKLQALMPRPRRAWYLERCALQRFPSDGLAALHAAPLTESDTPKTGCLDAHYAIVLRTGWEPGDVAAVVGAHTSPMGHLHGDNGSIAIGTGGAWYITDPGYQQYLQNSERDFSLGPRAHNAPVIDGAMQTLRGVDRTEAMFRDGDALQCRLDLTRCYDPAAGIEYVSRTVWHAPRGIAIVADEIVTREPASVQYTWHGHPDAAWDVSPEGAGLVLNGRPLWITAPQLVLTEDSVQRLRGSRGHLSLRINGKHFACHLVGFCIR